MNILSTSLITTADKEKIKRAIPKASNKIIAAAVARLYIAYPAPDEWQYTGLAGAIVLVEDTVGHTFFLKLVDVNGNRGVLWDQELYVKFEYNQDRSFFHSFEIEECYAGLLFDDKSEAAHFYKKVSHKEKHASKATIQNKNAVELKKKPEDTAKKGFRGYMGSSDDNTVAPNGDSIINEQRIRRAKGVIYYDDQPPVEWRSFYKELENAGITEDLIADNREFIKDYIARQGGPLVGLEPPIPRKYQFKNNNTSTPPSQPRSRSNTVSGKKKKAPPPPPPGGASTNVPQDQQNSNSDDGAYDFSPPAEFNGISVRQNSSVPAPPSSSPSPAPAAPPPPPQQRTPTVSDASIQSGAESEHASPSPGPEQSAGFHGLIAPSKHKVPPPINFPSSPAPPQQQQQFQQQFQQPPPTTLPPRFQQQPAQSPFVAAFQPPSNGLPPRLPPGPPARGGVPPPPPSRGAAPPPPPSRFGVTPLVGPSTAGRPAPVPPPPRRGPAPPPPPSRTALASPEPASRPVPGMPPRNVPPQPVAQQPYPYSPQQQPTSSYLPSSQQQHAYTPPPPPPIRNGVPTAPALPPMPTQHQHQQSPIPQAPPPPPMQQQHAIPQAPPPPMQQQHAIPQAPPPPPMQQQHAIPQAPPPPPMQQQSPIPQAPPPPPFPTGGAPAAPPPPPMMGQQQQQPQQQQSMSMPSPGGDSRDALLASIRNAGVGSLKKTDKSQLEKPSVLLQEAKGEPVSVPPSSSEGGPPGQPASLADALAAALSQRKNKVAHSDDEDDGDW